MACLFREPIVKANCVCSTINPRGSFVFFYVYANIVQKLRTLQVFLRGINTGIPERVRVGLSYPLRQPIRTQDSQQCSEGVKQLHWRLITSRTKCYYIYDFITYRTKCYYIQDFITFRTKCYYIQDFITFRTVITFRTSTRALGKIG